MPQSIIVLQQFDSAIAANIAKTKLDAYGVPCFLSEELLTQLYTPLLSGGVRLHIFEEDRERAVAVLAEDTIQKVEDEEVINCPACGSKRIISAPADKFAPSHVAKFLLQLTKQHYCLQCQLEFDD